MGYKLSEAKFLYETSKLLKKLSECKEYICELIKEKNGGLGFGNFKVSIMNINNFSH